MIQDQTDLELEGIHKIASKPAIVVARPDVESQAEQAISYLSSQEAFESVGIDPYWPKWNSPWWQMLLLHEMGLVAQIPKEIVERMIDALNEHYLKFFPFTEEELPAGRDVFSDVPCHCQLGTMHRLLTDYGVTVGTRLSWIKPWYLRYQLPDGGLNCDEAAYTRHLAKSSVVSTLPPMEAMLNDNSENLTCDEIAFLDRGADYLIEKRLFRKTSNCEPIDRDWLKLCFPRFYHYDCLRGLSLLLNWSHKLKRPVPLSAIKETVHHIDANFPDGKISVERTACAGANSRWWDASKQSWFKAPAASFPLLDAVSRAGIESHFLTDIWNQAKSSVMSLMDENLIATGGHEIPRQ